ncbi:MAG: calcium-binding protein [Actinomycetota bacterium]
MLVAVLAGGLIVTAAGPRIGLNWVPVAFSGFCQDGAVQTSYATAFGSGGYRVSSVSVEGISPACLGADLSVAVKGSGSILAAAGPIVISGITQVVPLSPAPLASAVDEVEVTIFDPDAVPVPPECTGMEFDAFQEGNDLSSILTGGAGRDLLLGRGGADILRGNAGADCLDGGTGSDRIEAGRGADVLIGGEGADRLEGGDGNDTLYGGEGADRLEGGDGNDTLYGGPGSNHLIGGAGADRLEGGADAESLEGGSGNDYLDGHGGTDSLNGGSGTDTCVLRPGILTMISCEVVITP